jgi:hypothetical protein
MAGEENMEIDLLPETVAVETGTDLNQIIDSDAVTGDSYHGSLPNDAGGKRSSDVEYMMEEKAEDGVDGGAGDEMGSEKSASPSTKTMTVMAATVAAEEEATTDPVTTIVFQSDWSTVLASPRDVPDFSPSLDIKSGLHGLGLRLAIERSRNIGVFLRDAGGLLGDVADVYDQFGFQLISASQGIRTQALPFRTSINDDLERLYRSTKLYGDSFRSLAAFYKTDILIALQAKIADNTIAIDAANGRYESARRDCHQALKVALIARSQYSNALENAEHLIAAWALQLQQQSDERVERNEKVDNNGSQDFKATSENAASWVSTLTRLSDNVDTPRIIQALQDVEKMEKQYLDAVEKEHILVDGVHATESSSLRMIQSIEQDLLIFYASSVIQKIFKGEVGLDGSFVSTTPTSIYTHNTVDWEKSAADAAEGLEKKGKELIANLFGQQSLPYEEGMGVMDAETLGLPPQIGTLRDQVKSKFSERETRIKTTEIVLRYLNDVSNLCKKTAIALKKAVKPRVAQSGGNLVSEWTKAASVLGAEAAYLWASCINVFFDEARMFSDLSTIKTTKLENWLANASRILQNEMEMDDTAWKLVCDSARTEMKYQSRYLKQQESMNKARERVSSVSSVGKSSEGSYDSVDDKQRSPARLMNSSLDASSGHSPRPGNRGRALLFKGGEAMKKLQEKARVQIAKTKLAIDEADQKEAKNQQAAEEALEAKDRAVAAYMECTENRIEKLVSSDRQGWVDLKVVVDELVSATESRRDERCAALHKTLSGDLRATIEALPDDVEEFLKLVKERIDQKIQSSVPSDGIDCDYYLTVDTFKTGNVKILLGMSGTEEKLPELEMNLEPPL